MISNTISPFRSSVSRTVFSLPISICPPTCPDEDGKISYSQPVSSPESKEPLALYLCSSGSSSIEISKMSLFLSPFTSRRSRGKSSLSSTPSSSVSSLTTPMSIWSLRFSLPFTLSHISKNSLSL